MWHKFCALQNVNCCSLRQILLGDIAKAGETYGTRSITTMARHWKQRLAARCCDLRRPAKHSWTDDPLRGHRQEEMGNQLRLHGDVCLRVGARRLGPLRLQN